MCIYYKKKYYIYIDIYNVCVLIYLRDYICTYQKPPASGRHFTGSQILSSGAKHHHHHHHHRVFHERQMGASINGDTPNGWFTRENPTKMMI